MNTWARSATVATILVAVIAPTLGGKAAAEDLREAVPSDVFLAVYGKHNSERDYQRKYYKEVWEAVEKSQIIERVARIVQARMPENDLEEMLAFRNAVREALEPIQWDKLLDCSERVCA